MTAMYQADFVQLIYTHNITSFIWRPDNCGWF